MSIGSEGDQLRRGKQVLGEMLAFSQMNAPTLRFYAQVTVWRTISGTVAFFSSYTLPKDWCSTLKYARKHMPVI